jgi:hypothetical protein
MSSIYEAKEWTNLWWDEADKDEGLPRVFLVGYSQTYGFYPEVIKNMEKEARITALTTSKNIDNPYLIPEFDHVITQFDLKYDLIHFNNGLHGEHQTDAQAFADCYERMINHILKQYPDSKLTLALSPPCYQGEHFSQPHEPWFRMAKERNEKVIALAEKYNLPVDDLFTPMLEHRDLHVPDGVHYNDEGRALLGQIVSDFIRKNL